jgi:hypothetical protein
VPRNVLHALIALLLLTGAAQAAEPKIIKVLPHLLDLNGRHTVSPNLFERDTYQAKLKANPDLQSGIRYDVHWRANASGKFVLKLELLGRVERGQINRRTIETPVTSKRTGAKWSALNFLGQDFKEFGPIVAWRVSLWQGDTMLARQQSFLWE